uniref:Uncharacterized protein n=1 Tax=Rhizophora mucronata TaxID=61149 RepID=A0A2P2QRV0_RHIMU
MHLRSWLSHWQPTSCYPEHNISHLATGETNKIQLEGHHKCHLSSTYHLSFLLCQGRGGRRRFVQSTARESIVIRHYRIDPLMPHSPRVTIPRICGIAGMHIPNVLTG